MTPEQKVAAIQRLEQAKAASLARWEADSCFSDKGDADRYQLQIDALVAGCVAPAPWVHVFDALPSHFKNLASA